MSDDRLYVDVPALTQGGINLGQYSTLASQIATRMRTTTTTYRFAGGTGEMGEQFDTNYRPGETKALQFLALLEEVVGGYSQRTLDAAKNFEQTENDANTATPHE
jgi:hypothetical protein